ncbi:hypothetical protein H257_12814 [Aphanomyces astaci]|uniref:DUF7769 domain-containing protein n=1 Tax=Aphanomyces astaci TaxID=112090 RepID=W4FWY8_APHAT|nr:hypothetical protein H257_12814 [Aphanomyces astaci]ETV72007.1 hypothetical protein H257_12814 [Aphanomyces astaci]|eukprot:XP_009838450.1 hypothetical protein H257_12814 [Aphanomyces astaci]
MPTTSTTAAPGVSIANNDKRKLSNEVRRAIYEELLSRSSDRILPHGSYTDVARMFNCYWRTVERVWTRGLLSVLDGDRVADVDSKFKGNSGGKRRHLPADIERAVKAVPFHGRQTLRSLAAQSGVPKTTLVRHMAEEGRLKSKSSYSKPYPHRRKQASAYGTRNIFSFAVVE